jgi:prepilin-type N-terminal cleavage/methylation domain-containing protein
MNSKGRKFSNNRGFTLIEVLISITILSFIMIGVINFTQSTYETSDRVTREDKELLQIETAMSRLEWDISQVYSPLYFSHAMNPEHMSEAEGEAYNQLIESYQNNSRFSSLSFDGLPIPVFKTPDKSTFIFFTTSNRRKYENSKQSHFAWVKYSLVSDDTEDSEISSQNESLNTAKEAKKALMLVRNVYTKDIFSPEPIEWDNIKSQVLLRKVISLTFEFWNPKSKKWTDNLELIENGYQVIYAVRVLIDYYDPDNIEKKSVRVFRPLYPEFKPEDMYKFLNAKPESTEGSENTNGEDSENTQDANTESGSTTTGGGSQNE